MTASRITRAPLALALVAGLATGLPLAAAITAPAQAQGSGQPLRLFPLPGQDERPPAAEQPPSQKPGIPQGTLPGAATDRAMPERTAPGQIAPIRPRRNHA